MRGVSFRRLLEGWLAVARRDQGRALALAKVPMVLLAAEVGLRTLPLGKAAAIFGAPLDTCPPEGPGRPPAPVSAREADALRALDALLSRWPERGRCLRRSLVVAALMRRRRPALRVGVSRAHGGVHAHAWIEIGGAAVAEECSEFLPLRAASR